MIRHALPELGAPSPETYARWFEEICRRTAHLMVDWMRVGFVHGVMNTDNMSILGLTIDYGPYGWLEGYDPAVDAQHDRRAGPALLLRQPAAHRAVEPRAARRSADPADSDKAPLEQGLAALRRDLPGRLAARPRAEARPARRSARRRRRRARERSVRAAAGGRDRHDAVLPQAGRSSARRRTAECERRALSSRCAARSTPKRRSRPNSSPARPPGCAATPRACGRTALPAAERASSA